jgi:hypothetical protein
VTVYTAEIRLAACFDRGLIEHGKGCGRLQQGTVSDSLHNKPPQTHVTRWVIPLKAYRTSIGFPLSSSAVETSKAARIDATPIQVDNSARCRPGHLLKEENISKFHSCPTSCVDAPPPKSKYTDLTGIHLRDMAFSGQEAVWVEIIRVDVNS